jgi:hypothetical protein
MILKTTSGIYNKAPERIRISVWPVSSMLLWSFNMCAASHQWTSQWKREREEKIVERERGYYRNWSCDHSWSNFILCNNVMWYVIFVTCYTQILRIKNIYKVLRYTIYIVLWNRNRKQITNFDFKKGE